MWIGVIGVVLIALGWIPEIIQIIKEKKSNLNLKFALLYTLGSLALTIYAIQLNDLIFMILNGLAFIMAAIGLYYTIKTKDKTRKSR